MTRSGGFRAIAVAAGVMGAAGVALAALAAHAPDASRLASASSMLLFHGIAALTAIALTERRLLQGWSGGVAAAGFVVGAALFAVDLTLRQFAGHSLFPMAAPTGGTLLIASWLVLAVAAGLARPHAGNRPSDG